MEIGAGSARPLWWAPLVIILMALAAYANAWPTELVHDDSLLADSERFAALSNIPRYFSESALAASGVDEPFYRPLLMVSITLDARLFGEWVAGYHVVNLILHSLVCLLLYLFLRRLLAANDGATRVDSLAALAATLIFAVHPVLTETVNSIYNRSEMLVALGGLAGLTWLLKHLDAQPNRAWIGFGVAYLFALLSKENAILLPGIAVLIVFTLSPGSLSRRVKKCLPALWLLIPLALYLVLRIRALAPEGMPEIENSLLDQAELRGEGLIDGGWQASIGQRLMHLFGIWFEALKVLVWPHPISIGVTPILPATRVGGLALNLVLLAVALVRTRRGHYGLLLGLMTFYLALLPATRIFGYSEVYVTLSLRHLYFPSIGLAMVLAFALRGWHVRADSRAVAAAVLAVLIVLLPLTWIRNTAWASNLKLYETEYRQSNYPNQALIWLTGEYLRSSNFEKAAEVCDQKPEVQKSAPKFSMHCAIAYTGTGRMGEAEAAHIVATDEDRHAEPIAHVNFAHFYLLQGRWKDARTQFEQAISIETNPANRELLKGQMLIALYQWDREKLLEAREHFEKSLELQPASRLARQWLARVNQMLGG